MSTAAIVAFEAKESSAYIQGEFVADTGLAWLVKPEGKPVQVLPKAEWWSVPVRGDNPFSDIFRLFEKGY